MKAIFYLFGLSLPLLAQEPVRYELRFPNAIHHETEVRVIFAGIRQPVLEVLMSRSSPGRYALHEFAKNVYNFRATDGQDHPLDISRPSPYQWNISGHKGTVVVEYTLFGDRADGTYAGIDTTHAHLNLPATLVWAHGFEKSPVSVKFQLPEGSNWKVATQLAPRDDGAWTAPNTDRLFDSPVELSAHSLLQWKTDGSQFRMALHHRGTEAEAAAYAKMAEAVVGEAEGVYGAFPTWDTGTYTFLIDYLPYVNSDGMEHRDSTVISGTRDLKESASQAIGTVAHEFFHCWNVKRIRPKSLEPFDFQAANMSGELWFAEGFTNYYGPLILQRAGLSSIDRFLRSMAGAVTSVTTAPGRQVFNVVDMSRRAPFVDAATANDPTNSANTFISYYTYGQALALGIDLSIRSRFPGKSLDDWMRAMWREHPDATKPYVLEDLEHTLASVTSREFAADIFKRHIYGMEPMDYEALLAHAGLLLRKPVNGGVWTGVQFLGVSDRGAEITGATLRGSPLFNAGLDRGDRILDWDGKTPKTMQELSALLDTHKPGDHMKLRVETRSGRKEVDLELAAAPGDDLVPYEVAGRQLTPEMKALRDSWLASRAVVPLPKPVKYCTQCKRTLQFEYDYCPYDGTALQITPGENTTRPARGGRGGRGQ